VNEEKPILDKGKLAPNLPASSRPRNTRRSARLAIKLPVRIRGIAASGEPFNEDTWTVAVSKHGARMLTVHKPAIGDIMEIENTVLNLKAEAGVVGIADDRFPGEMAVELLEPKEIWGIHFAPLDSPEVAEAPGQGPGKMAAGPATERAGPSLNLTPPTRADLGNSSGPSATVTERTGPAEDAGAAAARAEGKSREISAGLRGIELQALARLEESLTRLEANEKKAAALEQHLSSLQDCLRASRAELDELLTKFQEVQLAWQSEVDRAQGSIRDALDKASQHAARDLNQTLEKKAEAFSGQVAEGVRKRFEQEAAAWLDDLAQQATGRLSQLRQDCLAGARPEFTELTEQAKSYLVGLIQEQAKTLVEGARAELAHTLVQFKKKGAEALLGHLQKTTEDALKDSTRQIHKHANDYLDLVREELRAVSAAVRDDLNQHGARGAQETLANLSSRLRERIPGGSTARKM